MMVFVYYFLRRCRFLFSTNRNWHPVLVATGNHQHLIPLKAVITGENVGWQASTSNVPQMQRTIGIRPGNTDENILVQIPPKTTGLLWFID
jgi:hypothetical protein